jgi:hypothetical protein
LPRRMTKVKIKYKCGYVNDALRRMPNSKVRAKWK